MLCGNFKNDILQIDKKPKVKCDYLLYLPKDYNIHNDLAPLIIYLHGGSQRGKDLNKLKGYGLPYLINKTKCLATSLMLYGLIDPVRQSGTTKARLNNSIQPGEGIPVIR